MINSKNHPEIKEGEEFLTNTANPLASSIGWKTKRVGIVAYDIYGDKVQGLYPVFKSKDEIMEIPSFLTEMSEQMNNEDNRCTADPVWQVRCKRTRVTSSDCSDIFEIIDRENECQLVATNKENDNVNEQIVEYLQCDSEDLPVVFESWVDNDSNDETLSGEDKIDYFLENYDCSYDDIEGFDVLWVEEYEDIVQGAFLTEQDANWFINRKQHDYPKLYTYVASMYFCPQMKELRAWIKSLTPKT